MHGYDVNSHDRTPFFYIFAVVAGSLSIAIAYAAQALNNVFIPPSGLAIFLGVFLLFDKVLWKLGVFYNWGIVKIPNINGVWEGELFSSTENEENSTPIELSIHQSYSKIVLTLETPTSLSMSHMASIKMENPNLFNLRFEYFAQSSKQDDENNNFRHYGVTHFILKGKDGKFKNNVQHAVYYTEGDRNTSGRLSVKFKEEH